MLGTPGLAGQVLCSTLTAPRWPRNVRVLGVHWLQVGVVRGLHIRLEDNITIDHNVHPYSSIVSIKS